MEPISMADVTGMGLHETYKLFVQLAQEANEIEDPKIRKEFKEEYKKIYQQARFGLTLKFDIYTEFNEFYAPKTKSGKINIEGRTYELWEYFTELEERESLMKKFILDSGIETDIIAPR